jgi:hypothetical protein
MLAGMELGWFRPDDRDTVAIVLLGFSFPLQMLAAVFGFLGRDTAAATGFGVQGATWLVVGLSLLLSAPGHVSRSLGVLLLAASGWIAICAVGSALGKLVPAAVLFTTSLRFLITGLYELTDGQGLEHAAAVVGLILVVLAGYAALAMEAENLQRRTVLPLLRRGNGRRALLDDLPAQSARISHEAGAREQL